MKYSFPTILKTRHAARGFRSCLMQAFCLAALFFCLGGAGAVHGQAALGETWEWRNPLPQGSGLWAMAESDGNLVAVGDEGTVMTTTDGMSWTPRFSGTRNSLRAVAGSGATVVAVGGGHIVTSTDGGLTWALRSSSAMSWNTVIHGGGVWVAAGWEGQYSTGRVMTSPDGLTWTARTVPDDILPRFSVWTGLRFVLAGEGVTTSEDGITWTPRAWRPGAPLLSVRGLAWTGSRVLAVGRYNSNEDYTIYISPDGITWTDALAGSPGILLNRVVWTGTQLFAWHYSNYAYTSPTGDTWTQRVLSPNSFNPNAAAGTGTTLLVGGDGGRMVHSPDGGETWNPVSSGVKGNIHAITRFAGRWVAVGSGGSLTSSADGMTWTPASSGTLSWLRGIAWHNGLWVAVGHSILTSTDGVTWIDRTLSSPNLDGEAISSVIHAGSQWVATAYGAILTSPDGITWQERPVGDGNVAVAWNGSRLIVVGGFGFEDENENEIHGVHLSDDGGVTWTTQSFGAGYLHGIAWTGSQFVIVGDSGRILTSPTGDAGTWTYRTSGTNQPLMGVMAESGGLVSVGGYSSGPVIVTSPDGVTWTPRTAPTTQALSSISKAGSLYVATGSGGDVLTSPDAVTWTARTPPTTNGLYAAAWDGAQLLVAGGAGTILASTVPPLKWKSVVPLPGIDIGVRLTWFSTAGRVYDIESTTTLAPPWLPIPGSPCTATGPEEFIDFTEPGPSAAARRFFRVRERP